MKKYSFSIWCLLLWACLSSAHAADIYVSPSGSDTNSGRAGKPVASLAAAQQKARAYAGKEAVTLHIDDGIYYLPETLVLTPEDSGSARHPVVYKAHNEGGAVLSGGSELKLSWSLYQDGIYKAQTPSGLVIDQVFIDGRNQRMARYPNYDPAKKAEPYQGYSAEAFSKERAVNWADPAGGYIHAMHRSGWGGYHYLITGKKANGEVQYEGGWQNNRQMGMHKDHRMVENIFEELDVAEEWYHNSKTNTLYYKPTKDVDLKTAKVEVVRLRHLVEFNGSEVNPVKHITFKGFVVRHAARTFMDCKEQLLRSDWAIYRGGAFLLTGTENIQILDSEFDQVGGNAVFVNNYNRNVLVKGCHIHDAGASGICFVGDPNAVRDPLFEYGQKNDLSKLDLTVGPKTNNYPADSAVEDCLIHGIGRTERQPAGVQISMAQGIVVRDTSIYDTARAGINISEGTWGGHLIERCDVFDTVLETHDHGSFNSWGRDRFWRSDQKTSQAAIDENPELPYLDAMKTTIIRDSRWRCDHGWDIDLDDGSTNYEIYNNLMLNNGLKLREGFRRRAWNNITVNNGLHPHVWYDSSRDEVYGNIFMRAHRPARMAREYTEDVLVNNNFYAANEASIMKVSGKLGWDKNSVFGDPMFIDPANGDFRVKERSAAFEVGFKNFSMDQFGVKKPSLKAIARTPVIPSIGSQKGTRKTPKKSTPHTANWMGADVRDLSGVEFSAYGVSKESGGVALVNIATGSAADKAGLRSGDLIQGVNGKAVKNIAQFLRVLSVDKSQTFNMKVVRDQKIIELTIVRSSIVEIESASSAEGFKNLRVPSASGLAVSSNSKTRNEPLSTLTDGKLGANFGPIIGNGIHDGAYKVDLGSVKVVTAVNSWSYQQRARGAQKFTVYGSNSTVDPGWDLKKFTALGSVDTGPAKAKFTAASLRALDGEILGSYRWIVWAISPVTVVGGGENTAFQEFAVDVEPTNEERAFAAIKRPNIVFLLTDDQRWDTLGCYGRTDVITPNIDKLAEKGVAFDNAFYAVAICMPSRATMFTGRYFSDHQSGFTYPYNRTLTKEEFADSYPAQLKDIGYRTGFVGKFGIRLEGSNRSATDYFDYFVSGNNPIAPRNDPELKHIYRKDRPANERTLKKGDAMIRFLETQPKGQPFCLSISFDAVKNDRDRDMYPPHVEVLKDMEMWVPPNWVEGKSERLPAVLDYCRGTYLHVARTSTPEEYQRRTRRFAVQGYTVDKQVERLMNKLEEMGVLDNTIVIYTSDNGRFHGSQGLFDKAILYEESMKQPLIVFDGRANADKRGKRVDAMVSSVDVAPTILSLAGVEVPDRMKGVDLRGLLEGTQDMSEWRDSVLMENFFIQEIHSAGVKKHPDIPALNQEIVAGNRSYRTQGVRTDRFKYFRYHEHDPVVEELYDLDADPYEQNNLISNPEYAEVLSKLQKETEALITQATE